MAKKYDARRSEVVKYIAKQFEVTESYVRQCIASNVKYGRSEEIKRAFNKKYDEVAKIFT